MYKAAPTVGSLSHTHTQPAPQPAQTHTTCRNRPVSFFKKEKVLKDSQRKENGSTKKEQKEETYTEEAPPLR